MATLADVWAALFPAVLPATAPTAEQLSREVAWVRVLKARVPAFDALDAGDLVIVPASVLAVVAPERADSTGLAEALAAAGVAAVILLDPEGAAGVGEPREPADGAGAGADSGADSGGDSGAGSTADSNRGTATGSTGDPSRGKTATASRLGPDPARTPGPDPAQAPAPVTSLDSLGDALAIAQIATFRLVRSDPIQLERAVIGYLVNRRAELEQQAAQLEAALEELALGDADLPALVAAIAGFLGRAVALEAASGQVVAAHAPPGIPGAPAAVAAYLGGTRTAALRVPLPGAPAADSPEAYDSGLPGRSGRTTPEAATPESSERARRPGRSGGRLVLLGTRPASELERVVGTRIARLLALELARDEAVHRAADQSRRGEQLPAAGPPWAVLMARQIHPGRNTTIAQREELRTRLRLLAPARRLAFRGDAESLELRLVLALTPTDPTGTAFGAQAAGLLGRVVAVSRPFDDPLGRPVAEAESRATLEAAESLADPPAVAQADRLAAYRLLTVLHALPDGQRHARALLGPLLVGSRDAQRERLATVRAVLEHPGYSEAATALGVHRNTLSYRIRRIEQLSGWRLADPELRIPLLVALELVQLD